MGSAVIEELASVTAVDEGYAWVQTRRESACQSCSAQKGCGTSSIGKLIGKQYTRVRVLNPVQARVGDVVKISLPEDMLLKSSLAVYLLPLLLMLLGGAVGDAWLPGQWAAVGGSLAGLLLGVCWLKLYARLLAGNPRFQPKIEQVVQSATAQQLSVYTP